MKKEQMIKQLENIQSLMACDIFNFDLDDCTGDYDNDDMYKGLTMAIANLTDFEKKICSEYVLYELKENTDLYIEEVNFNDLGYDRIKYVIHNHKTNESYHAVDTLTEAKCQCINWNRVIKRQQKQK